jgi:hypothetical protein
MLRDYIKLIPLLTKEGLGEVWQRVIKNILLTTIYFIRFKTSPPPLLSKERSLPL